jgi:hypothetical protein
VADGSSVACDDLQVTDCILQNTTSGGVFLRQCNRTIWRNIRIINIQSYHAAACSAGIEIFFGDDHRLIDCSINGYYWKGFNIGGSNRSRMERLHVYGGTQQVGQGAHYESQGVDCAWIDCMHEGQGFGFKAYQSTRPVLRNYIANGSSAMAFMQGSSDFRIEGGQHIATDASNQTIIIESSVAGAVLDGGLVTGVTARRPTMLLNSNAIGVQMISSSGAYPLSNITIRDCLFKNMYITVWTQHASGATFNNLVLENIRSITQYSYAFLLYPVELRMRNCRLDRATDGQGPITVYSAATVPSKFWEIADNFIDGLSGTDRSIDIGYAGGASFPVNVDTCIVRGNRIDNGLNYVCVDLSGTAGGAGTNYIKELVYQDNVGRGSANATAIDITLGTVQKTNLTVVGNVAVDGSGNPKNMVITNAAQCFRLREGGNMINAIVNYPSAGGLDGFYGAQLAAQTVLATGAAHTVDDVITKMQALGLVRQS